MSWAANEFQSEKSVQSAVKNKRLTANRNPDSNGDMKIRLILIVCLVVLPLAIVCNFPPSAKGADEQAVRDADAAWAKAAAAKDLDKTVSFYSDDAIVFAPNQAAVMKKDGIRELWKSLIGSASSVSWKARRVKMAKSGDMACLSGTYELTMNDGTKDRGKYCEVWEKQADGTWKCGTDIWNSDLPAAPSSPAPGVAEKK